MPRKWSPNLISVGIWHTWAGPKSLEGGSEEIKRGVGWGVKFSENLRGGVGWGVRIKRGGRGGGQIFQRNKRKGGNFLCSTSFFYLCMHCLW